MYIARFFTLMFFCVCSVFFPSGQCEVPVGCRRGAPSLGAVVACAAWKGWLQRFLILLSYSIDCNDITFMF